MTDSEWEELLETAQTISNEWREILYTMGRELISKLMAIAKVRFKLGNIHMSSSEWVTAFFRYWQAAGNRNLSEPDIEKAQRWAFGLSFMLDSLTAQVLELQLGSANPELKNNKILQDTQKVIDDTVAILNQMLEQIDNKKPFTKTLQKVVNGLTTIPTAIEMLVSKIPSEAVYDEGKIKTIRASIQQIVKEMGDIEESLGIKTTSGQENYTSIFADTLAKCDAYVRDNPREYTWRCPACGWEGTILIKKPVEDTLINKLDLYWVWRCPVEECKAIIAYDQTHPLFDGKMLWNKELYRLLEAKKIDIFDMANILGTSPEYIIWGIEKFNMAIPEHVKKQFEVYDKREKIEEIFEKEEKESQ